MIVEVWTKWWLEHRNRESVSGSGRDGHTGFSWPTMVYLWCVCNAFGVSVEWQTRCGG